MNVMNKSRRLVLKSLALIGSLPLLSNTALAAWPKDAFSKNKTEEALNDLYGMGGEASDAIVLKAPDIAENGAVVPVKVTVKDGIEGVTNISIFIDTNPNPLAATFELTESSVAEVSTRVKMGKSSNVMAAVQAGDKVYTASKEVKVTIGGCGG